MKLRIAICLCLLLVGCNTSIKEVKSYSQEELIMVEPSEMANLMNEMYAFNASIKELIKEGELHGEYPDKFNKIYSAALTDPSDRDQIFESFSNVFVEVQKSLFEVPRDQLVPQYNKVINACISCHNKKCVGPVPRIKKLLITD